MSGNLAAAGIEKDFWFVSTPQLDEEELSWQFGSSTSLSYSRYIVVDKQSGLGVNYVNDGGRKTKLSTRSADTQLGWDVSACEASMFSCPEEKVDYYSNVVHDKAFEGEASFKKKLRSVHNSVNPRTNRYDVLPYPAQNDKEQVKISSVLSGENEWASSQSFQPQLPDVNLQTQPHKFSQSSLQRNLSFVNFENAPVQPEKLGEALCHSQTRARNAENLATDVLIEKEKLAKLLFREANICRTYKERAHLLELENLSLKSHSEHGTEVIPAYCNVSESSPHCKFYQKGMSKGGSSLPGTVGLAFALGLSCASAGFVIGCCMGLFGFSQ